MRLRPHGVSTTEVNSQETPSLDGQAIFPPVRGRGAERSCAASGSSFQVLGERGHRGAGSSALGAVPARSREAPSAGPPSAALLASGGIRHQIDGAERVENGGARSLFFPAANACLA